MPTKAPTLEFLVNQCCEDRYNKHVNNPTTIEQRKYFSNNAFKEFINKTHCLENLNFLIEIYHYEQVWNKIFRRKSSILKCKEEQQEQQRISSSASIFNNLRHDSITTLSIHSIHNSSHESLSTRTNLNLTDFKLPSVVQNQDDFDARSFANVNLDTSTTTPLNNNRNSDVWDALFKTTYCDSNNSNNDCHCSRKIESVEDEFNNVNNELKLELIEKFNEIIKNYVLCNSIYEINLPYEIYLDLTNEFNNSNVLFHSPLVLLPAKNAVLQLLRENIYNKFVSEQEQLIEIDLKKEEINKISTNNENTIIINSFPDMSVIKSNESMKSIKSPNSLTSFLNKYHLKIHDGNSTASLTEENDNIIEQQHQNHHHRKLHHENNNTNDSSNIKTNDYSNDPAHRPTRHHDSIKYIKGPCNISPTMSSYDPKPPIRGPDWKGSWSKSLLKFKRKKKSSLSSNNSIVSMNSSLSTNSTNSRNSGTIDTSITSPCTE